MNIKEMRDKAERAHTTISVLEVAITVLEQASVDGGGLDVKVERPIAWIKKEQKRLLRLYDLHCG